MLQPSRAPEFVRLGYDAAEGGMAVEIKCDEAGGKNNKSKVLKEAIAMMRKNFCFPWSCVAGCGRL